MIETEGQRLLRQLVECRDRTKWEAMLDLVVIAAEARGRAAGLEEAVKAAEQAAFGFNSARTKIYCVEAIRELIPLGSKI